MMKVFALIYTIITLLFYLAGHSNPSASLGYGYMLAIFWIICGGYLVYLFMRSRINLSGWFDYAVVLFCTPLPAFLAFGIGVVIADSPSSTYEFNSGGYRHQVKYFDSSTGKRSRIEFYRSTDVVTDENSFPASDTWIKDSIWIYYDRDGNVVKTEDYRSSESR